MAKISAVLITRIIKSDTLNKILQNNFFNEGRELINAQSAKDSKGC